MESYSYFTTAIVTLAIKPGEILHLGDLNHYSVQDTGIKFSHMRLRMIRTLGDMKTNRKGNSEMMSIDMLR